MILSLIPDAELPVGNINVDLVCAAVDTQRPGKYFVITAFFLTVQGQIID